MKPRSENDHEVIETFCRSHELFIDVYRRYRCIPVACLYNPCGSGPETVFRAPYMKSTMKDGRGTILLYPDGDEKSDKILYVEYNEYKIHNIFLEHECCGTSFDYEIE